MTRLRAWFQITGSPDHRITRLLALGATTLLHCLTAGPRRNCDRIGELKGHNSFRLQHNLLAFSGCGYARSGARSGSGAYGRAFTATEDTAQDRSSGCSVAYLRLL